MGMRPIGNTGNYSFHKTMPGGSFSYSYDGLKRLSSRNLCVNDATFLTREYSYLAGAGTNGTTTL